jgi:hypothetical protein
MSFYLTRWSRVDVSWNGGVKEEEGSSRELDSFESFVMIDERTKKQVLTFDGLIRWRMGTKRAARDITFIFELLKDENGVVPIDSLLELLYGDIEDVSTNMVEVPGCLGVLAIAKARLLMHKINHIVD